MWIANNGLAQSILDLFGQSFVLLTDLDGEAQARAAVDDIKADGVDIDTHTIPDRSWGEPCGVGPGGGGSCAPTGTSPGGPRRHSSPLRPVTQLDKFSAATADAHRRSKGNT
jgi:hypothetical protein